MSFWVWATRWPVGGGRSGGAVVCAGRLEVYGVRYSLRRGEVGWRYDGGELGEMDARLLHTTRLACVGVTRLRAPQHRYRDRSWLT
jgi:hypothetical protein